MFRKMRMLDYKVTDSITKIQCPFLDRLMVLSTYAGTGALIWWIALAIPFVISKTYRNTGIILIVSLGVNYLIGEVIIKKAVGRGRPSNLIDQEEMKINKPKDNSFPSGHTASSFCAFAVTLELSEYVVPDLHKTVAVAAGLAVRLAAAVFFAAVVVDFRAGTAGAGAMLPEVVFLAKAVDPVGGNTDLLVPDLVGFVILQIDGRIQSLGIHSHHLGQEFPAPVQGFSLEVISEGKVAQHLKKGGVASVLTDILNIAGTDAFLAGGNPLSGRNLLAGKVGLQRRHTGVDEKQ